jgi:hypothetical protein
VSEAGRILFFFFLNFSFSFSLLLLPSQSGSCLAGNYLQIDLEVHTVAEMRITAQTLKMYELNEQELHVQIFNSKTARADFLNQGCHPSNDAIAWDVRGCTSESTLSSVGPWFETKYFLVSCKSSQEECHIRWSVLHGIITFENSRSSDFGAVISGLSGALITLLAYAVFIFFARNRLRELWAVRPTQIMLILISAFVILNIVFWGTLLMRVTGFLNFPFLILFFADTLCTWLLLGVVLFLFQRALSEILRKNECLAQFLRWRMRRPIASAVLPILPVIAVVFIVVLIVAFYVAAFFVDDVWGKKREFFLVSLCGVAFYSVSPLLILLTISSARARKVSFWKFIFISVQTATIMILAAYFAFVPLNYHDMSGVVLNYFPGMFDYEGRTKRLMLMFSWVIPKTVPMLVFICLLIWEVRFVRYEEDEDDVFFLSVKKDAETPKEEEIYGKLDSFEEKDMDEF